MGGGWVDPIGRYRVVWKLRPPAAVGIARVRVINRIGRSNRAKVTATEGVIRHSCNQIGANQTTVEPIVREKEDFVLLDWAPQRDTTNVLVVGCDSYSSTLRSSSGDLLGERICREGPIVPIHPVRRSVEVVCAGFRVVLGDHASD